MDNAPVAVPTLRPLRVGELLDQAIRLYRRNFLTFIGIIAVVYVPIMLLQTGASALMSSSISTFSRTRTPGNPFFNTNYLLGMGLTFILALVQIVLVQGVATGALTNAVANNYLGKKTGIGEAYRGIGGSWLKLLAALFMIIVISLILLIWWIVPCIGWFTGFGMFIFIGLAVSPLVAPVVVLEGRGVFESLRRAWSLSRRRFWWMIGCVFVLYLFSQLIVTGPVLIGNLLLTSLITQIKDLTMRLLISTSIQAIISLTTTLLYMPLQLTAITLIYFDLRVRTEGFDLALMTMAASPSPEPDPVNALHAPAPDSSEKLITGSDLGNFAILTLGGLGVYVLFISILTGGLFFLFSLMR